MNKRVFAVTLALGVLLSVTGVAIYEFGFVGFLRAAIDNTATLQVLTDLCIAMGLFAIWMWRDAKQRGVNAVPYLVAVFFLGSIGALIYLLGREWGREKLTAN